MASPKIQERGFEAMDDLCRLPHTCGTVWHYRRGHSTNQEVTLEMRQILRHSQAMGPVFDLLLERPWR